MRAFPYLLKKKNGEILLWRINVRSVPFQWNSFLLRFHLFVQGKKVKKQEWE